MWANYYRSIGKTDPSVKQGPERRRPLVKSIEKKVTYLGNTIRLDEYFTPNLSCFGKRTYFSITIFLARCMLKYLLRFISNCTRIIVESGKWLITIISSLSRIMNSNIYIWSGYLVDGIVIAILLWLIGILWFSMDDSSSVNILDDHHKEVDAPDIIVKDSRNWVYIVGGIVVLSLVLYLGVDMYHSYHTTLNYIDPKIKPLFLPPYAGIQEVIPLEIGRTEIISMFEPKTLESLTDELISPASPMLMHGYWE